MQKKKKNKTQQNFMVNDFLSKKNYIKLKAKNQINHCKNECDQKLVMFQKIVIKFKS
jgi:hypothetical protein